MKFLEVPKRYLILLNGLLWLSIGLHILYKGLAAYVRLYPDAVRGWHVLISLVVYTGFVFMFRRIVRRYTDRILAFPTARKGINYVFSLRGYLLIAFMMGLGISVRFLPFVTDVFYATFYTGLGCGLTLAGILFFKHFHTACKAKA